MAVQDGHFAERNPETGARITVSELAQFACEDLHRMKAYWTKRRQQKAGSAKAASAR